MFVYFLFLHFIYILFKSSFIYYTMNRIIQMKDHKKVPRTFNISKCQKKNNSTTKQITLFALSFNFCY